MPSSICTEYTIVLCDPFHKLFDISYFLLLLCVAIPGFWDCAVSGKASTIYVATVVYWWDPIRTVDGMNRQSVFDILDLHGADVPYLSGKGWVVDCCVLFLFRWSKTLLRHHLLCPHEVCKLKIKVFIKQQKKNPLINERKY